MIVAMTIEYGVWEQGSVGHMRMMRGPPKVRNVVSSAIRQENHSINIAHLPTYLSSTTDGYLVPGISSLEN